ncbi:MAG TPA: CDP-alcohol phosphatidyltransferase family protein [Hypericibacter adhaerens]|uniref:CDP-diacylglycerol--glycerol-3-phosphate 3-phosphatidyltransferase n=1 Tax=Hypericibacter adhaerens TaxID=2602016 RepID=A0A5J6N7N8_9PROT|nr:CDP-alcohol phosphatidyltransferase family protein [Hypericibacter adhaerens]QEX23136.1 CDP-alcohol phosphatidyltransferase [Hypericibacter adhaerens]HWA45034.1 CDP-alcohol phosphatidyltransferase family protein [Hypericibacter adhaerens]
MSALLPNLITLGRLLAVPLAVWLMLTDRYTAAFWLFITAGVSDAIDGFLARRLKAQSEIGAYLDPLADKCLLVSSYVTLGHQGHLDSWLVILVVFRDLLIIGGALLYQTLTHSLTMQPLFISKLNTVLQIALIGVVLAKLGLGIGGSDLVQWLGYAVAASTLASGGAYVAIWGRRVLGPRDGRGDRR